MAASPSYGDASPIAAIATPLGESALAVIRTSGPGAVDLLAGVFSRPGVLRNAPGSTVVHGWILEAAGKEAGTEAPSRIDEALVSVYRAPRSYTGEESADISCHGGIASALAVMRVLRAAGFRDSLPGEFTFRAFMNGKLDLTRAESVMEMVSAKTEVSRERAVLRLSGVLEEEIQAVKSLLVRVLAGIELLLDYSEDEADPAGPPGDLPLAQEALTRLRALAASYRRERLYRDGALVVIAGRPNAGKSSLFNLLLREERSIVTSVPGTTRDWIEAWIAIEGIPIRLADTAGLHESDDPVERLGMERSRELLSGADLALYLIDGGAGFAEEDRAFFLDYARTGNGRGEGPVPVIPVWNKADIAALPADLGSDLPAAGPVNLPETAASPIGISAKTGEGIPALTSAIAVCLKVASGPAAGDAGGGAGIATERQKKLISAAIDAVEEALALEAGNQPLDLVAPPLREAVNALGEITGEVTAAEILETMFSRFCVGK
ncbi:MAG: tRNA uridine-5-carboxymethylaminomethyl(34) synthesis GTPase MnmE [Treponema sp.]|jgi:tRNA modification GTPase|nr:tRNA uridine-5-carboxymethylaminomethyl(34) synthesis GTPase MnmE [Treponema sp.]